MGLTMLAIKSLVPGALVLTTFNDIIPPSLLDNNDIAGSDKQHRFLLLVVP